jgi:hypothetical protein
MAGLCYELASWPVSRYYQDDHDSVSGAWDILKTKTPYSFVYLCRACSYCTQEGAEFGLEKANWSSMVLSLSCGLSWVRYPATRAISFSHFRSLG